MKAIYEPKGKAKEYGGLACNLYRGCGHGCTYCYVPKNHHLMRTYGFKDRQEFYDNPQPREGIIEALKKDAKKIGDKYKRQYNLWESAFENKAATLRSRPHRPEVFLCFTCDPYQPINKEHQLTRQAIEILHGNEIAVNILTKGVITDFDLLEKRPDLSRVGVTITGLPVVNEYEKIDCLRGTNILNAKKHNISTWVSMEPIIDTEAALHYIKFCAHIGVDEIKIGKWNYDKRANDIDWHKFVNQAIELLERLGCKYHIKESLRKYI